MKDETRAHELQWLLQTDFLRFISEDLGRTEWVVVYDRFNEHGGREHGGLFSAVLPTALVGRVLEKTSTDMTFAHDRPGCSLMRSDGDEVVTYDRFGQSDGIEPFVVRRWFNAILPAYQELLEEFRLFHNLYHQGNSDEYLMLDTDGDEHVVARVSPSHIEVKLHQLRQFLAVKEAHLALYFDRTRNSTLPVDAVLEEERHLDHRRELARYSLHVSSWDGLHSSGYESFSRVLGKRLIAPLPKEKSGMWPYERGSAEYEEFIVGVSDEGDLVTHTCDPDLLSAGMGAGLDAPGYLTEVFFRRDVLGKYYSSPSKYEVHDNRLACGDLWGLRMDNNHPTHVVVFLGDLGSDLSYNEQRYWRTFNVPPDGVLSNVTFKRAFLAQFADPEMPDLLFKYLYDDVLRKWPERYGWSLLRPLEPEDEHCLIALHVPLTDEQREFDEQVLNLAKLLVDCLNESELRSRVDDLPQEARGIDKLEGFLRHHDFPAFEPQVAFLRDLQLLRSSSAAHLKGKNYEKARRRLGIETETHRRGFKRIAKQACDYLRYICSFTEGGDADDG